MKKKTDFFNLVPRFYEVLPQQRNASINLYFNTDFYYYLIYAFNLFSNQSERNYFVKLALSF